MNIIEHRSACILFVATVLIALIIPVSAHATQRDIRELRYDIGLDLAVTAINAAGFVGTSLLAEHLAPDACRWCGVNSFDDWGHRNIPWSNTDAANTVSHITAFAAAPLVAFGLDALAAHHDDALSGFPIDALIIAEATSIAAMFTQIIKFSSGRERPSAPNDNTSFYSNHTSIAFALAVSSGTVATMRGYRMAPWIWGAGLAVAATTGYLRVAADRHYLTDVITGAVMGSTFGFCIPYFFHRSREPMESRVMISAVPFGKGGLVSISGHL